MPPQSASSEESRAHALSYLRTVFPQGSTVYTVLNDVNPIGTSRRISVFALHDGDIFNVTPSVAAAIGARMHKRGLGLVMGGCGMDMGFEVAYRLGSVLYPAPTCTGESCPSNEHANGDDDYSLGKPHRNGGYSLRHRWL